MGGKNWFEVLEVSKNRGFEKSGVKLQCLIQGKRAMVQKNRRLKKREIEKSGFHCTHMPNGCFIVEETTKHRNSHFAKILFSNTGKAFLCVDVG